MPFKPDLRKRLHDLKLELEAGILPQVLYEEMCRETIAEYGLDPFEALYSKNIGDTVAILTPAQSAILTAIGDIDINVILPVIRRYRKRMLRSASEDGRNKVLCPECGKEFINSQGLSTHLLARHRQALDDYYIDNATRKLIKKPPGWTSSSAIQNAHSNDPRLELSSMDSLASAAAARSAVDGIATGGDGLWLVQQVNESDDDENDIGNDDNAESSSERTTSMTSVHVAATKVVNDIQQVNSNLGSSIVEKTAEIVLPNLQQAQNNATTALDTKTASASGPGPGPGAGSNESSSDSGEEKTDRRKFNRGVKQRKSYSKEIKLSAIGMRDQGKCTDEISSIMGIPKSNVEKWCSAKGRQKILRDIYREVVAQKPKPVNSTRSTGGLESQLFPLMQSLPNVTKPFSNTLTNFYNSNSNNVGSKQVGQDDALIRDLQSSNSLTALSSLNGYSSQPSNSSDNRFSYSLTNQSSNLNGGVAYKMSTGNNFINSNPLNSIINFGQDFTSASSSFQLSNGVPVNNRHRIELGEIIDSESDEPEKRQRVSSTAPSSSTKTTVSKSKPAAKATTRKPMIKTAGNKKKVTPTSTATAAAVVAQNISFNNDGFSDSDDDNEVMGLLGEQLPMVALQRLAQMRST